MIFLFHKSYIETYGFSDIIFAYKTREANITWTLVQISLRSNITRRKANITEKSPLHCNKDFSGAGDGNRTHTASLEGWNSSH